MEFNLLRASRITSASTEHLLASARVVTKVDLRENKWSKLKELRDAFDFAVERYGGIKKNRRFTKRQRSMLYAASASIEAQLRAAIRQEPLGGAPRYLHAAVPRSSSD